MVSKNMETKKESKKLSIPKGEGALPFILSLIVLGCEPETQQTFIPLTAVESAIEDHGILEKSLSIEWLELDGEAGYLVKLNNLNKEEKDGPSKILLPSSEPKKLIRI